MFFVAFIRTQNFLQVIHGYNHVKGTTSLTFCCKRLNRSEALMRTVLCVDAIERTPNRSQ